MEDKVNYTIVGAFVLGLGAALIFAVLWLAAGFNAKKQYETYQSIIPESVAGLNVDAPVKYLGVDVGKVSAIGIDPRNTRQVRLLLLIERGTPIKQDTEAVLKTQGLTGIAYVELSPGSAQAAALVATREGEIPSIRSKPSLSARLENVATAVLANVDRMSTNLNGVFDADNRAALKQTLADTATLMHALAAQQHTLVAGIADAARTARRTAQASEQIEPALRRIAASADAVQQMADAARRMADAAGLASAGVGRTADAAASGVQQFQVQTLPDLAGTLAELSRLAVSLRRLSEQTERNPSSLLLGGPARPAGPGEKAPP